MAGTAPDTGVEKADKVPLTLKHRVTALVTEATPIAMGDASER